MTKLRIIKVNQANMDIALDSDIWGRKWGTQFGWQILTQQAMVGANAEKILKLVG